MAEMFGAGRLFTRFINLIAPECREWFEGMTAEADHIPGRAARLKWAVGTLAAILRIVTRKLLTDNGERPFEVVAAAGYLGACTGFVLVHLASEVLRAGIHESWYAAWFPLVVCVGLALIPAVIAFGVWICDDFARKMATGFVALDIAMVLSFVYAVGPTEFRLFKFCCDVAILAAMLSTRVKDACRWREVHGGSFKILGKENV